MVFIKKGRTIFIYLLHEEMQECLVMEQSERDVIFWTTPTPEVTPLEPDSFNLTGLVKVGFHYDLYKYSQQTRNKSFLSPTRP